MNREDSTVIETPMYEWYRYSSHDEQWHYDFLDQSGMGWQISVEHLYDTPPNEYHIIFLSWSGDEFELDPGHFETIEKAKQYALDKAQELFPSVTITDEATR